MATITGTQSEKVFQIKQWLGLNEGLDGDTKLKLGEAAAMRNFRVTRDGNLAKRPGADCIWAYDGESTTPVLNGAWYGIVDGKPCCLAIVDDAVYSLLSSVTGAWDPAKVGDVARQSFMAPLYRLIFGFDDKAYILGEYNMYCWDGTTFAAVAPYVPIIGTGLNNHAFTTAEQINKLTPKRRVWLSPDGTNANFWIPEECQTIDYVKDLTNNTNLVEGTDYTVIQTQTTAVPGGIHFTNAPREGVNSYEIGYTVLGGVALPRAFRYATGAELYNGDQLNRVFVYGDGSNQALYSGIRLEDGKPDATYFPDLNVVSFGDESEKITNMIRYNHCLITFTDHATYTVQYGQQTLADGSLTAAFYVTPVHRSLGASIPGTAQMVMNSPVVVFNKDVYSWAGNNYGTMTADERQAKRISDRIHDTLAGMGSDLCCYDDNYNQAYYISDAQTGKTLVWNYANDCWYLYTGTPMAYAFFHNGRLHYFTRENPARQQSAALYALDDSQMFDADGSGGAQPIDCYWESGSMSFGVDYQRKYSAMLWVGVLPAPAAEVYVTAKTDRSATLTEKVVGHSYSSFVAMNFTRFSFNTSHRPKLRRLKIKAKKFVYYKLIFSTNSADSTATVTTADIRVRFTGYAK